MRYLVTGAAGFIGFHVCQALLKRGDKVVGLDNINDYYDPALKLARLEQLQTEPGFRFKQLDLVDSSGLKNLFLAHKPERVIHLAAQAGVRYSLSHPMAYADSNLTGFLHVLEACRHTPGVGGLIYASSSSVYGGNTKVPFSEKDPVDAPVSLYAATKKANELMAHTYAHLYGLHCTGLRFFTVYGPWGRPDMAYFSFTKAILAGDPIRVFNHGKMRRDFTYIDDIVKGVLAAADHNGLCEVFNLGNNRPVELGDFIRLIELAAGRDAIKQNEAMQAGDVLETWADIDAAREVLGYQPTTPLEEGLPRFVDWYRSHYALV